MLARAYAAPMRAVMRHASAVPAGVRSKSTKTATMTRTATKPKTETAVANHEQSQDMFGDFVRPQVDGKYIVSDKEIRIAEPQTPPEVKEYGTEQAPNFATTWSESQRPKSEAMKGPRFEQVAMEFQPAPLSAMELISNVPVQVTTQRVVSCDGGKYYFGFV